MFRARNRARYALALRNPNPLFWQAATTVSTRRVLRMHQSNNDYDAPRESHCANAWREISILYPAIAGQRCAAGIPSQCSVTDLLNDVVVPKEG